MILGLTGRQICIYGFAGPVVLIEFIGLMYFVTKWIWLDLGLKWGEDYE